MAIVPDRPGYRSCPVLASLLMGRHLEGSGLLVNRSLRLSHRLHVVPRDHAGQRSVLADDDVPIERGTAALCCRMEGIIGSCWHGCHALRQCRASPRSEYAYGSRGGLYYGLHGFIPPCWEADYRPEARSALCNFGNLPPSASATSRRLRCSSGVMLVRLGLIADRECPSAGWLRVVVAV